jgi:hypothetical protein
MSMRQKCLWAPKGGLCNKVIFKCASNGRLYGKVIFYELKMDVYVLKRSSYEQKKMTYVPKLTFYVPNELPICVPNSMFYVSIPI